MQILGRTRLVPSAEESAASPGYCGSKTREIFSNAVAGDGGRCPIKSAPRYAIEQYAAHDEQN